MLSFIHNIFEKSRSFLLNFFITPAIADSKKLFFLNQFSRFFPHFLEYETSIAIYEYGLLERTFKTKGCFPVTRFLYVRIRTEKLKYL